MAQNRVIKTLGFVLLVAAVGATGVAVGSLVRQRRAPITSDESLPFTPNSLLKAGDALPEVTLTDAEGQTWTTLDLLDERGSVFLFLDTDCPPCNDMTGRWQRAIDTGLVHAAQVVGIAYRTQEQIERYRAASGLQFSIYRDAATVFRDQYEVAEFPLEVMVGASGTTRGTSYNSTTPIDAGALRHLRDE